MNRKNGFYKGAFVAIGLVASVPTAAQVTELTLGQSLTPTDRRHTSEFTYEFDGRTTKLQTALYLQDPDVTLEDTAPPAFIVASCRPGRVVATLSAIKYLEGYLARALPERAKDASTTWAILKRTKILEAHLAIQDGKAVVAFSDQAAVDLLAAIYESTSPVDLVLFQADGKKLARAVPTIVIRINRSKKPSMSALAQTLTYCETMVATRR